MRNKRKTCFTLAIAASVCLSATIPAYASTDYINNYDSFWEDSQDSCYIIDFMDYDGNLLDSRICAYGEILTDIKIPETREDEEYIYQFVAWEPEVSEIVTECAAYMATYQKIRKDGATDEDITPEPVIQEQPEPPVRVTSDGVGPDEVTQVSSTSYDVTRFTLDNTSEPKEEEPAQISQSEDVRKENAEKKTDSENVDSQPESQDLNLHSNLEKTPQNPQAEVNAPLPFIAPSAPDTSLEATPTQIAAAVHMPDTVPARETPLDVTAVPEKASAKEIPADSSTTAKPKRSQSAMPTQDAERISENKQTSTDEPLSSKFSISEASLSETKQSSKIPWPVPLVLIGLVAYGGISQVAVRRKRT